MTQTKINTINDDSCVLSVNVGICPNCWQSIMIESSKGSYEECENCGDIIGHDDNRIYDRSEKDKHKIKGLQSHKDYWGNIIYFSLNWPESYEIKKLNDGTFQSLRTDDCISNNDNIEDAIKDIEYHIEGNK